MDYLIRGLIVILISLIIIISLQILLSSVRVKYLWAIPSIVSFMISCIITAAFIYDGMGGIVLGFIIFTTTNAPTLILLGVHLLVRKIKKKH